MFVCFCWILQSIVTFWFLLLLMELLRKSVVIIVVLIMVYNISLLSNVIANNCPPTREKDAAIEAANKPPHETVETMMKVAIAEMEAKQSAAIQRLAIDPTVMKWNEWRRAQSQAVWQKALEATVEYGKTVSSRQIYNLFPVSYECDRNQLMRIGGSNDGGKWICGEFFPRDTSSVVVSIGSNGDFSFEQAVLKHTNNKAQIYTFDCTGTWKPPHAQIHLYPWCLSREDHIYQGRIYKSWQTILKDLKLEKVDLLKMDIEGYEWNSLPFMLEHPEQSKLPRQISLELHFFPPDFARGKFRGFTQPEGTPENLIAEDGKNFWHPAVKLMQLFDSRGYQVSSNEYNHMSVGECCSELTYIRVN
jgi:Na+-transporting methylmalonyl-CoA/oxaloacetate decarboxylase gamma subunit